MFWLGLLALCIAVMGDGVLVVLLIDQIAKTRTAVRRYRSRTIRGD
jgi:hypothetical protein